MSSPAYFSSSHHSVSSTFLPTRRRVGAFLAFSQRSRFATSLIGSSHSDLAVTSFLLRFMRRQLPAAKTPSPLSGFSVRRTPRACHGACDRLRPGSLRASHAVCLAARTLEPVICARKEGADIECVSTTKSIFAESLVMQRDLSDSCESNRILRHESALHSTSLASELQSERINVWYQL